VCPRKFRRRKFRKFEWCVPESLPEWCVPESLKWCVPESPREWCVPESLFESLFESRDEAFGVAADRAEFCVARYRQNDNLRTQFSRIVERAGVVAWPKMFVNLRSTRRTELQERFADHVVNKWLGHSGAVAAKYYLQVTDEHWAQAIDSRSPTGSPIDANQAPSGPITETKKPRENRGFDGLRCVQTGRLVPPQGLEPWTQGLRVPCSTN